jgi:CRP/FNR family transcriptional regulator, dissimilatory nitrate respiration regulator
LNAKAAIKACPLFVGATAQDLEELLRIARPQCYRKGQVLFSEGEEATGFFVPMTGKVKLFKLSPEGRERILRIAQPGRTFAEAAIFDLGLYPANAQALDDCTVLYFPKPEILRLLHDNAQLAIHIIGGISRILRELMDQMEALTFRDVPARLSHYLLDLAGGRSAVVRLPVSKTQLAANLGTVGETLSRTLRRLVEEDLIRVRGRDIEILDPSGLQGIADRYKE